MGKLQGPKIDPKLLGASASVLATRAEQFREALAQRVFDQESINQQLAEAASEGHTARLIAWAALVHLEGTKAAQGAIQELRARGFVVEWVDRPVAVDNNANLTGKPLLIRQLRVSWA